MAFQAPSIKKSMQQIYFNLLHARKKSKQGKNKLSIFLGVHHPYTIYRHIFEYPQITPDCYRICGSISGATTPL